jgi:hypothetical protein
MPGLAISELTGRAKETDGPSLSWGHLQFRSVSTLSILSIDGMENEVKLREGLSLLRPSLENSLWPRNLGSGLDGTRTRICNFDRVLCSHYTMSPATM